MLDLTGSLHHNLSCKISVYSFLNDKDTKTAEEIQ